MSTRRQVSFIPPTAVAVVAVAASVAAACNVDAHGHYESLSGGTYGPDSGGGSVPGDDGGDGADETGEYPPEAGACVFDDATCTDDVDCCFAEEPPAALVPAACPSAAFPFNWSCDDDACVHTFDTSANGCNSNTECADLIEGYVCVKDGGEGRCAPGCNLNADCVSDYGLPSSFSCDTIGTTKFCRQPT